MIWKISRLFPNTLSADVKYSLLNRDNLKQPIQMQLSRKKKTFCDFFLAFLKSSLNFEHFLKKLTLIADVFPKLRTQKNLVRSMPKKSRFKGSFKKQHGKCAQTLLKCEGQLLCHIYWSLLTQLSYKKYVLVICKISRLFINTLSADGEYSLFNRDNLTQRIQMQLSRKQKSFSEFFSAFLKSSLNFQHFRKERWPSLLMYFQNYWPRKTLLDQCLKSLLSRDPSKSNMVNAPKGCWNVKDSSFTKFIDHC